MSCHSFNDSKSSFTPYNQQSKDNKKEISLFSRLNLNDVSSKNSLNMPLLRGDSVSSELYSMRSRKRKGSVEFNQLKSSQVGGGNRTFLGMSLIGKSSLNHHDFFGQEIGHQEHEIEDYDHDDKREYSEKSCPVAPSYDRQEHLLEVEQLNKPKVPPLEARFKKTKNMLRTISSYLHKFILHSKRSRIYQEKYFRNILYREKQKCDRSNEALYSQSPHSSNLVTGDIESLKIQGKHSHQILGQSPSRYEDVVFVKQELSAFEQDSSKIEEEHSEMFGSVKFENINIHDQSFSKSQGSRSNQLSMDEFQGSVECCSSNLKQSSESVRQDSNEVSQTALNQKFSKNEEGPSVSQSISNLNPTQKIAQGDPIEENLQQEEINHINHKIERFHLWIGELSLINFSDYEKVWTEENEFLPLYRQLCYKYYKEDAYGDIMRSRLTTKQIINRYMPQLIEGLIRPKLFFRFR